MMAQMSNIKYKMNFLHLDFIHILLHKLFPFHIIFCSCCHHNHILKYSHHDNKIKHSNFQILYNYHLYIAQEYILLVLFLFLFRCINCSYITLYNTYFFQFIYLEIILEVWLYKFL